VSVTRSQAGQAQGSEPDHGIQLADDSANRVFIQSFRSERESSSSKQNGGRCGCGAHREEDLLRLLDGALVLVLSPVDLRGGGAGAREALDRRLELVQRALPALPRVGLGRVAVAVATAAVGLLLERAAPQQGRPVRGCGGRGGGRAMLRRAAEAAVDGEVGYRGGGGGGHGAASR